MEIVNNYFGLCASYYGFLEREHLNSKPTTNLIVS